MTSNSVSETASAREEIFARVRAALTDIADADPAVNAPIDWVYGQETNLPGQLLDVFAERVADYRAVVVRCPRAEVATQVAVAARELGAKSLLLPPGLEQAWVAELEGVELVREQAALTPAELNEIDGVVTAAAVGIAETGTIVLDHGPNQGRRALTLVPDRHICVVDASQVVSSVPQAVTRLKDAVVAGQPLTWISGPSATSDIELSRVEGVHGPRSLYVIIAE